MNAGLWTLVRDLHGRILWTSVVLGTFLLPYAQLRWWSFPASSVLLLALFVLKWRGGALQRIGVPVRARSIVLVFLTLVGLWSLFKFAVIPGITSSEGLRLEPFPPWAVAEFAFQAFNEEILLGYVPLSWLVQRSGRPVLMAVLLALVFALLHFALYRYGELGETLAPATLAALTFVGITRHGLILIAGHMGLAWALHAAWNLSMFAGRWRHVSNGDRLSEPEVFDALFGAPLFFSLVTCAAVVTTCILLQRTQGRTRPADLDHAH